MCCLKKLVIFCMFCRFMKLNGFFVLYFGGRLSWVRCWLVMYFRYWCMFFIDRLVMLLESMFLVNWVL